MLLKWWFIWIEFLNKKWPQINGLISCSLKNISCSFVYLYDFREWNELVWSTFSDLTYNTFGSSSFSKKTLIFFTETISESKYKILLYSQDTTSTCYLFIKYMMKRYHFTKEDIIRLIHITKLPPVYKKQMDDILQTL